MSRTGFLDVRLFDELDSTNRYVLDEARAGAPEGLVAVADHQSAGRGRLQRTWEAPPGASLLVSVLLRPTLEASSLHLATVLIALAARQACSEVAGVAPDIKWPNDLVVDDRKLAGILAEVEFSGPARAVDAVVVGIGINVMWPGPPEVDGVCLQNLSVETIDRTVLLDRFLEALAAQRYQLDTPRGRRRLAEAVRTQCSTLGRRVRVQIGSRLIEGFAVQVDDEGRLLVDTDAGRQTVSAGDVTLLRPIEPGADVRRTESI